MKKIILFVLLAALFVIKIDAVSNVDSSYWGKSNCWSYNSTYYQVAWGGSNIIPFPNQLLIFTQTGDTLVKGKHYQIQNATTFFLLVRQENKKVYVIYSASEEEVLLYDFGAKTGDTIFSKAPSGYIGRIPVVGVVDSVTLYTGERRKRLSVEGDQWIEGIGSIRGFDYPLREFVTCDCNNSYQLAAFTCENTLLFYDSEFCINRECCKGILDNIPNTKEELKKIAISPNPTKDYLTVENISEEFTDARILDLKGIMLKTFKIESVTMRMDLTSLNKGVYLIRLTGKQNNITKLFFKE